MKKHQIEADKEVIAVSKVLKQLEQRGLKEPCIASGWTRAWLTDTVKSDIDIAYVGKIDYDIAKKFLKEIINKEQLMYLNWDINGIWNAEIACPVIKTTKLHYLIYYVCSIDSVYLASDGQLYDPTGYGFQDAENKILRMHDFQKIDFNYLPVDIVYFCLEGCRRIAKFGWAPTERSNELILFGTKLWKKLSKTDKEYFYQKKIIKKFNKEEWASLSDKYNEYHWGFIFDETEKYMKNKSFS